MDCPSRALSPNATPSWRTVLESGGCGFGDTNDCNDDNGCNDPLLAESCYLYAPISCLLETCVEMFNVGKAT